VSKDKGRLIQTSNPTDDIAMRVEHVAKSFKLPHNRQNTLKSAVVNLLGKGDRTFETQEVLRDVNFEIKKGEFFGIVGRNGSGKSTLLKMLAGIYTPTKGTITVNGSLTPFIELGVGFNPELTGRENVYLNGALLGFNNKEVDGMYHDIVSFAELERFMDQKLKNYSSGMQVRLAFSIAIRARSDILLLDEVLAVGDAAFQQKCFEYFHDLKEQGKTVVFISHDMDSMRRFCSRAMYIKDGDVIAIGEVDRIAQLYLNENFSSGPSDSKDDIKTAVSIKINPLENYELNRGDNLSSSLTLTALDDYEAVISISLLRDGLYIGGFNTKKYEKPLKLKKGENHVKYTLSTRSLSGGGYRLGAGAFTYDRFRLLGVQLEGPSFTVINPEKEYKDGIADIDGEVKMVSR
jgi:ABC-2 type transport system ATP-binding protein